MKNNKTYKREIDEKKWRLFDLLLHVIITMASTFCAEIISTRYFNNSFGIQILFIFIFLIVLIPIYQLVLAVVEQSTFLRKPFEKKE